MIFPGLRKLGKEFNFSSNGTFLYGYIGNTYLMFADGSNQKNLWFRFPVSVNAEIKQKVESWKKKGYAKEIKFLEKESFDVIVTFVEYLKPFNVSKIKEVILDITSYINEKYPDKLPHCSGDNCYSFENLSIYDFNRIPLPLCNNCYRRLNNIIENSYEELKNEPNNYLRGSIFSLLFSIPVIIFTICFMLLGKILGVSGLLHFYLAHKGYIYGKGKNNIFGVFITTCISFAFTILGTYLGYIGVILKSLLKDSEMKLLSFLELLKKSFAFVQNPEVKKELFTNLKLSLFLCGICIVFAMIQAIRSTRKVKIKKA